jgi:wyosine [tRNA(Phe)-imidazoG37] synthetase (radical SAM superfamily)
MISIRENKMLLELQKTIIYGPINSRRLGRSLGVNILPFNAKICPFNCVYCQYGWTDFHQAQITHQDKLPSVDEVQEALIEALLCFSSPPAYITFSGNGEPTIHPDFGKMAEAVNSIRDRMVPEAKTAILSNAALVGDKNTRRSLEKLDLRVMKLDCGSVQTFKNYNQPSNEADLDTITHGLAEMEDVVIQALFTSGKTGNLNSQNIHQWLARLKRIKPFFVQIYTLDRVCPAGSLRPATHPDLVTIKKQVEKIGLLAGIF